MTSGSDHGILILGLTHPFEISGVLPDAVQMIYDSYRDDVAVAKVAFLFRAIKANDPEDPKGYRTHR